MAVTSEIVQRWVRNLLLAFVLVTIGFAVGKEVTLRGVQPASPASTVPPAGTAAEKQDKVLVYYVHATFRCETCNTIEKMTRSLLDASFAGALADGRIEWKEADFQKDEALAQRYEIVSSCVVVVNVRSGKETGYKRLDEVWTLMSDPPAFDKYVGDAVREYLPPAAGEGGKP